MTGPHPPAPRRELASVALLCAAGALLAVLAAGRAWATVRAPAAVTPFSLAVTGRELAPAAAALGWAGLAGLAALVATRGRARTVVGALLALFGAVIAVVSTVSTGRADVLAAAGSRRALLELSGAPAVTVSAWWAISLAGGLLLAAGGVITVIRGHRWPGMSARYDRPGTAARSPAADDPAGLWKSLDRGEDPTVNEHEEPDVR
ncbi:MFS transporter [Actinomadura craniellae]|uniref:MFS transporter n=1 Tax=Actinomadura craniellae TaxID=2231787 RepID=A0A365HC15_9ACTN|nr:Trp biosynthesis-associated membrane protein [Actinomadura craniellae]RAY16486.1 MFS transporter [Actinomadura craniellae]